MNAATTVEILHACGSGGPKHLSNSFRHQLDIRVAYNTSGVGFISTRTALDAIANVQSDPVFDGVVGLVTQALVMRNPVEGQDLKK